MIAKTLFESLKLKCSNEQKIKEKDTMKKILAIASMMLLGFSGAYAAGTAAGTQIQNSVTLDYTVGGVNQPDISANDGNGFVVDNKNDVLVTLVDTASVKVTPGAQDQSAYIYS